MVMSVQRPNGKGVCPIHGVAELLRWVDEVNPSSRPVKPSFSKPSLKSLSFRGLSDQHVLTLFARLCKGYDSPYSRVSARRVLDNPLEVLNLAVDPRDYDDPYSYASDRQVGELLRKYPFGRLATPESRKAKALQSVLSAEARCADTNKRILQGEIPLEVQPVISLARKKIRRLLGRFDVVKVLRMASFGPGLVAGLKDASEVALCYKISGLVTATPSLQPFLGMLFQMQPGWARCAGLRAGMDDFGTLIYDVRVSSGMDDYGGEMPSKIRLIPRNRITTVPKTAIIDRPAEIQNSVNQFMQLGTGKLMRILLKSVGIDLRFGQSFHRELARFASRHPWLYATIDLSNASDTIAYRLVERLLPADWFYWLCLLRNNEGVMPDGTVLRYEKFSSMGNGYTFELESLIFWALASACEAFTPNMYSLRRDTHVYGDDIIVDTAVVPLLEATLESCGFEVNHKKSFTTAHPFRESCGGDFFSGVDVRPLYITKRIQDEYDLVDLLNRVYEHHGGDDTTRGDARARFARLYLLQMGPKTLQELTGPFGLPGVLWDVRERWDDKVVYDRHLQGWYYRSWGLLKGSQTALVDRLPAIFQATDASLEAPPILPQERKGFVTMVGGRVALRNRTEISVHAVDVAVTN